MQVQPLQASLASPKFLAATAAKTPALPSLRYPAHAADDFAALVEALSSSYQEAQKPQPPTLADKHESKPPEKPTDTARHQENSETAAVPTAQSTEAVKPLPFQFALPIAVPEPSLSLLQGTGTGTQQPPDPVPLAEPLTSPLAQPLDASSDSQHPHPLAFQAKLTEFNPLTPQIPALPPPAKRPAVPNREPAATEDASNHNNANQANVQPALHNGSAGQLSQYAKPSAPAAGDAQTPAAAPVSERKPEKQGTPDANGKPSTAQPSLAPAHLAEPSAQQPAAQTAPAVSEQPKITEPAPAAKAQAPAPAAPLELHEAPAPRTEPARDISFRIAPNTAEALQVKLTDRAGQVHVAVHSADPALTKSLQTNLSDLTTKLEQAGYRTETSLPGRVHSSSESQQNQAFQDQPQHHRNPQQQLYKFRKRVPSTGTVFSIEQEKQ